MRQLFAFSVAVLLLTPFSAALLAQQPTPAIAPAKTPAAVDSTRQIRSAADTIPPSVQRNGIRVGSSVLTPDELTDTLRVTPKQEAQIRKIVPRKATIRSLIFPGLGQAYNRQYYKMPFIYAGYGALGYFFVRYRRLAREAEEGYRLLLYGPLLEPAHYVRIAPGSFGPNLISNPNPIYVPDRFGEKPEQVVIGTGVFRSAANAKNAYDFYRRYRDINVLLSVVLYAVSAVEANVAAHLKTFDLSDDISMTVEPHVLPMPGTGPVPGVRVALTFK